MTYEEIKNKYMVRRSEALEEFSRLDVESMKLRQQAERYARLAREKEEKASKMRDKAYAARYSVSWLEQVRDILQELTDRMGIVWNADRLTTFGISCECPVYEKGEGEGKRHLYFYPSFGGDDSIRVWNGERTDTYERGTIGELNSGNFVKVPVESIEQLVEILNKQTDM